MGRRRRMCVGREPGRLASQRDRMMRGSFTSLGALAEAAGLCQACASSARLCGKLSFAAH